MVRDWPRDTFSRQQAYQNHCFPTDPHQREQSFSNERFGPSTPRQQFSADQFVLDSNGTPTMPTHDDVRRRTTLMQIDDALRLHCGINASRVFVASVGNDGSISTFSSPGQNFGREVVSQFFDSERYHKVMNRIEAGASPMLDADEPSFGRHSTNRSQASGSRRGSVASGWDNSSRSGGRKRQRPRPITSADDDEPSMATSNRTPLMIGDSDAVWNFYEQRFKSCQQTACKLIAKAWVKAVEPKKQSTHPYTGSDEKAPEWWPKPWGPTKDDKVRHKEPDHLYKRERVHLLAHILRLVVEPNEKQHPDIRKLNLNVAKLEDATWEALSTFFMENKANALKRQHLTEIFKVATSEQKHRNDEIDGTTQILIKDADSGGDAPSDTEDYGGGMKDDDDVDMSQPKMGSVGVIPSNNSFIDPLPVRNPPFSPGMLPDLNTQHFPDPSGMHVHGNGSAMNLDMVGSPHDHQPGSRRPSVIPGSFSSPVPPMYTPTWQAASGQQNPALYSYASQQDLENSGFVPSSVQEQNFMAAQFDPNHSAMFRQGDMSGATGHGDGSGYDNYLATDSRAAMGQHM